MRGGARRGVGKGSREVATTTTLNRPLVATLAGLALTTVGALPSASPAYAAVNSRLLPLAVPLLLFSADLRRAARDARALLPAFAVGAAATVVATVAAFHLLPLTSLGPDVGWRVAAALAARRQLRGRRAREDMAGGRRKTGAAALALAAPPAIALTDGTGMGAAREAAPLPTRRRAGGRRRRRLVAPGPTEGGPRGCAHGPEPAWTRSRHGHGAAGAPGPFRPTPLPLHS